jgi:hypothetical protein
MATGQDLLISCRDLFGDGVLMRLARGGSVVARSAAVAVVLLVLTSTSGVAYGFLPNARTLRLTATPSIVRSGREVTVRVERSRRSCTVALIRSGRLLRVWRLRPHHASERFRTARIGALTVSTKCGSQTRIAPVWVVSRPHDGTVVLGREPRSGRDAGGPIVVPAAQLNADVTQRSALAPIIRSHSPLQPLGHSDVAHSAANVRSAIVSIAQSQRGVSSPANSECNPYSASMKDASSPGCSNRWYDEEWCADFAAWVWRQAGVSFTYSYTGSNINAWAASFYAWGLATGNWHPLSSGYQPQPGDVAVFGGLAEAPGGGSHVGIYIDGPPSAPTVVNGNWDYPDKYVADVYEQSNERSTGESGGTLDGYVSVPNGGTASGGTGGGGGTGTGPGTGSGYQPPDAPDGYQHLFGLESSGEPEELYFEPDVANTMGEGPLMSTPGTADVASTVDSAGDIIVYTLGSDGSVYQVYYQPGVAGTMGEGYIGTLPGAVRISAVTGPDGYQHILGVTASGLVEELYYEPSVANTVGEGPLMSTPGTADIAAATDSEGYINVYTLGVDGAVYSIYYKPAVAGTMGEGPLQPIPGATELSAVG